jgi:hypothetical protein
MHSFTHPIIYFSKNAHQSKIQRRNRCNKWVGTSYRREWLREPRIRRRGGAAYGFSRRGAAATEHNEAPARQLTRDANWERRSWWPALSGCCREDGEVCDGETGGWRSLRPGKPAATSLDDWWRRFTRWCQIAFSRRVSLPTWLDFLPLPSGLVMGVLEAWFSVGCQSPLGDGWGNIRGSLH